MSTDPQSSPFLTGLCQFAELKSCLNETAVFEFFVSGLPRWRDVLVASGLERVPDFFETPIAPGAREHARNRPECAGRLRGMAA